MAEIQLRVGSIDSDPYRRIIEVLAEGKQTYMGKGALGPSLVIFLRGGGVRLSSLLLSFSSVNFLLPIVSALLRDLSFPIFSPAGGCRRGKSVFRGAAAGCLFKLFSPPLPSQCKSYVGHWFYESIYKSSLPEDTCLDLGFAVFGGVGAVGNPRKWLFPPGLETFKWI